MDALKIFICMLALISGAAHADGSSWSSGGGDFMVPFSPPASSDSVNIINNINNNRSSNDAFSYNPAQSNNVAIAVDSAGWQQTPEQTSYEIDPNTLQLIVKYEYNLTLRTSLRIPLAKKQVATDGTVPPTKDEGPTEVPVPPGRYWLRTAVFLNGNAAAIYSQLNEMDRNLLIKERLISWDERAVTVRPGGLVNTKIVLPFRNHTSTIMANHILFELTELDNNGVALDENNVVILSKKQPLILAASFVPFREQGNPVANESPFPWKKMPKKRNNLGELINDAKILMAHKNSRVPKFRDPVDAARAFARASNLRFINLNSSPIQAVLNLPFVKDQAKKKFFDFFKTQDSQTVELYKQRPVIAMLCELMARRIAPHTQLLPTLDCLKNPHRYLRVGKNVHVAGIGESKVTNYQRTEDGYDISGNYAVCRSHSEDRSATWGFNPFGILVRLFESTGLPSPVTRTYSVSESNGRSQSQCMSVNENTHIDVTGITVPIELKRFLTCVSVMPAKNSPWYATATPDGFNKGYYICNTKEEKNITVFEDYLHAYEPPSQKSLVPYLTPGPDKANFAFRGGRDLVAFIYGLKSEIRSDLKNGQGPDDIVPIARTYLESTPNTIPNVISIPVEMEAINISAPTFWKKVLGQYEEKFNK